MIPQSVLVTGGSGFIGSHVVRHLAALGHQVTTLDFRPPADRLPNVEHLACDLRSDPLPNRDFDNVIHLAGLAGVRPSLDRPIKYEQSNVLATVRLLEFCRERSVPRFVFASSSSVYGPNASIFALGSWFFTPGSGLRVPMVRGEASPARQTLGWKPSTCFPAGPA